MPPRVLIADDDRSLRAAGDRTPVLMLTARVETPDRVAGLDASLPPLSQPPTTTRTVARTALEITFDRMNQ